MADYHPESTVTTSGMIRSLLLIEASLEELLEGIQEAATKDGKTGVQPQQAQHLFPPLV